jgi:hypothetical protein
MKDFLDILMEAQKKKIVIKPPKEKEEDKTNYNPGDEDPTPEDDTNIDGNTSTPDDNADDNTDEDEDINYSDGVETEDSELEPSDGNTDEDEDTNYSDGVETEDSELEPSDGNTDEDEDTNYSDDIDNENNTDDPTNKNPDDPSNNNDDDSDQKNKLLINDFINLYESIKNTVKKLTKIDTPNIFTSRIVSQVINNYNVLQDKLFDFITIRFNSNKYVENLYQYNYFIQAFKLNLEILKKVSVFNTNK